MDSTIAAFLSSWSFDPWLCAGLAATAAVYLRGAGKIHRRSPLRQTPRQTCAFLAGLATLLVALASPLDAFSGMLLSVHMLQHLLLAIVAPVLILVGGPARALELGLPRALLAEVVIPLRRARPIRWLARALRRPPVAAALFVGATWLWHLPPAYELALRSDNWHRLEHATFLLAGLVFWRPVVAYLSPAATALVSRHGAGRAPYWLLPYLFVVDLAGTALSAVLAFSGRVLYPHYAQLPDWGGVSPLEDQALAGALMWVLGSAALLAPLAWIGYRLLIDDPALSPVVATPEFAIDVRGGYSPLVERHAPAPRVVRPSSSKPEAGAGAVDLLSLPWLGWLLRRPATRLAIRIGLALLAAAIVLDGLTGPQVAGMNLAGVLPWIHWRGLAAIGLLALGNIVCYGCPLTLARGATRRWLRPRWDWPRPLQNKWLAALLLAAFLLAYEVFDLWASPLWTAWIVVGYFLAAALVDALFRGAAFCKYVCPIGQFQFAQSLVAAVEVGARDRAVCASCRTHDCLHGNDRGPGCELDLFVPQKSSNLDCTFCLACVHACPSGNVGLLISPPLASVVHDRRRSGIGRLSARPDLAALLMVFVFGAFVNALGMVAPVVERLDALALSWGWSLGAVETAAFLAAAAVAAGLVLSSAAIDRRWSRSAQPIAAIFARSSYALVPIGVGMWLAHYGFHLFAGLGAFIPAGQRFLAAWGWRGAGLPNWSFNCCAPVADWILKFELLALDAGLLASLYLCYRLTTARQADSHGGRALASFLPWGTLIVLLFALGVWTVFQPMEMRGMLAEGSG